MNQDERLYQAAKAFRHVERGGDYGAWERSKGFNSEDRIEIGKLYGDIRAGRKKLSPPLTLGTLLDRGRACNYSDERP